MKSIAPISTVFIMVMFFLTFVLILIPTFIRHKLTQVVEFEHGYDNAQSTLLTLISSTHNGKPVLRIISGYIVLNEPNDLDFIREKLDRIVVSKCYELSTSSEKLVKSPDCDPKEYTAQTKIVLPYNPEKITEELILVID